MGTDQRAGHLLDHALLAELAEEFGAETLQEIADSFAGETADMPARLAAAGDAAESRALLHFLRGAAANVGLVALAGLVGRLEQAARGARQPDAAEREAVAASLAASTAALHAFADGLDGARVRR